MLVAVAQLVEHWIVAPVVAGSSPVGHPKVAVTVRFGARSSMDRASDFGSEGWEFESLRARQG